jgi:hypothetical protein
MNRQLTQNLLTRAWLLGWVGILFELGGGQGHHWAVALQAAQQQTAATGAHRRSKLRRSRSLCVHIIGDVKRIH